MTTTPTAPPGYRALLEGEVIRKGDVYLLANRLPRPFTMTGRKYDPRCDWPAFRPLDRDDDAE